MVVTMIGVVPRGRKRMGVVAGGGVRAERPDRFAARDSGVGRRRAVTARARLRRAARTRTPPRLLGRDARRLGRAVRPLPRLLAGRGLRFPGWRFLRFVLITRRRRSRAP